MFFGAFLVPIFLVAIANACVFVCAGYVIIKHRLKQQEMKQAASMKKQRFSSKEAWKLLISLVGFMILLGLSWVILLFTVVGADTNIYAAFAIQWLFVFFNSLQGFFIFIFFVVVSSDMRKEWKILLKQWKSVVPWLKNKESSNRYNRHLRVTVSATSTNSSKATPKTVVNLASEQELRVRGTTDNSMTVSTGNLCGSSWENSEILICCRVYVISSSTYLTAQICEKLVIL